MSYFGVSGPEQDGGFIQGIQLGAARLHNAKMDRKRHAKSLGASRWNPGLFQKNQGYPDDSILNQRATNYVNSYDNWVNTQSEIEAGRLDSKAEGVKAIEEQYQQDRKLIAKWAESGPYVHEAKAMSGALLLAGAAVAVVYLYNRTTPRRVDARQGAFQAVFS